MNVDAAMRDFNPGWAADQARFEDLPAGDPDFDWGLDGAVPCCGPEASPEPEPSGMEHWPESDYTKWLEFEQLGQPPLQRRGSSGQSGIRDPFWGPAGWSGPLENPGLPGGPIGVPWDNPCDDPTLGYWDRVSLGCLPEPDEVNLCDGMSIADKIRYGCLTVQLEEACVLGHLDPTPPPMSEWSQEGLDCYTMDDESYDALGAECAEALNLDTCRRPCNPPTTTEMNELGGLIDIGTAPGTHLTSDELDQLHRLVAFLHINLDLLMHALCLGTELYPAPGAPVGLENVAACVAATFSGASKVELYFDEERPGAPEYEDGRIYMLQSLRDQTGYWSDEQTSNSRLCMLIAFTAQLGHEILHHCGTEHYPNTPSEPRADSHDHCLATAIVARNFAALMARRYRCAATGCGCERMLEPHWWGHDIKGTVYGTAWQC